MRRRMRRGGIFRDLVGGGWSGKSLVTVTWEKSGLVGAEGGHGVDADGAADGDVGRCQGG